MRVGNNLDLNRQRETLGESLSDNRKEAIIFNYVAIDQFYINNIINIQNIIKRGDT